MIEPVKKPLLIFDTTLRDGEQSPGCAMSTLEKVQIASALEHLGVDVIEAGFAMSSPNEFLAIQELASKIKNTKVASLARSIYKDIDMAAEALKTAVAPRIHIFIASSPIHMKHKLGLSEDQVYERAISAVSYAKKFYSDIEFSAEDATRSDFSFLQRLFEGVIKAGATTVNVPDTVGYSTPDEFYTLIKKLKESVSGMDRVALSCHCHNDLGLAVANTLAAVKAGVDQVEVTLNGIGERAGNAALEEVVMGLTLRQSDYQRTCNIQTQSITPASRILSKILGIKIAPNKPIVGENVFMHASGIHQHGVMQCRETYEIMTPEQVGQTSVSLYLSRHSGKNALRQRYRHMGYTLSEVQVQELFDRFKELAALKKQIYDEDLQALILDAYFWENSAYVLEDYVSRSIGVRLFQTEISLSKEDKKYYCSALGKGPIESAFNALTKFFEDDVVVEDFSIHSLTKGADALGESVVKLSKNGRVFIGRAVSTDIVKSSIQGYINAMNSLQTMTASKLSPQSLEPDCLEES